jgi:acetoin utilization deacetylase AcuC-like enzyme
MTLIGPGTWEAARAAVDVALTAADLVGDGEPFAYACTRPPGHHVTRSLYGGSCYLNNTAIAANALLDRLGGPVAVVDIDAHHGNGTQELFLGRTDVLTASVHVDPGAGWFPHFLGFAAENDEGNLNLPLAPGSRDIAWLAAVQCAAEFAAHAKTLVVALGVDAAESDPESPLEITPAGYREAGRILGRLGLPTVVLQEGGYDLATIGPLVVETLAGLATV